MISNQYMRNRAIIWLPFLEHTKVGSRFSLLYSLGMFIVLLSLIGPESDRFSVSALFKRLLGLG